MQNFQNFPFNQNNKLNNEFNDKIKYILIMMIKEVI